jgi:hypothetical protein
MIKSVFTAIPVYCNRVCFHFAWCTDVLLVETKGDMVLRCIKRPMLFTDDWDIAHALVALKIDQLACGAIPLHFREWFESKQVRIIDFQCSAIQALNESIGPRLGKIIQNRF